MWRLPGTFAVAVDLLHGLLKGGPAAGFYAGYAEDGGEMLAASLLVWYAFRLQNRCPYFSRATSPVPPILPGLFAATYMRDGEVKTAIVGGANELSAAGLARRKKLKLEG